MGSIVSDKDAEFVYVNHLNPMLEAKDDDKIYYTFWLATKENSEIVGEIGFRGIVNQLGEIEFGYFVNDKHRGNGYATEMVKGLTEWALKIDKIKFVVAGVGLGNSASARVLLKNGFKFWGEHNNLIVFYKS